MSAQELRTHIPFADLLHSLTSTCHRVTHGIKRARVSDQIASPLVKRVPANKSRSDSFWATLNWDQFLSQNLPSPGSTLARNANDPSRW